MLRGLFLAILGFLLLGVGPALSGPVRGHYRISRVDENGRPNRLEMNQTYTIRETFKANERACVIIEGDHNPVANITLKVHDANGKLVAADTAGGDIVATTWYPPRTQQYTISITSDGKDFNVLEIVVK